MSSDDRELVASYIGGDSTAFEELMRRHETHIYNLCLRMLSRPEDARDATQEAFLTAFRKLKSFRGDAAFGTWIHRVAVNACYDQLRRRKRRPEEELPAELGSASDDPAEAAVRGVDVRAALSLVPDEFRVVLILHDVQDLAYEAVAEILEIPVGTVKSRLHRGRVALAGHLEGTPDGSPASEEEMKP